jgi:pilus assembly protein CpaB
MKFFGKVLMVLAFILSLLLAGLIYVYLKDQQKPVQQIERADVLVARETIPARTKISESQLTWISLEKSSVADGVALKLEDAVGLYSKDALYPNEPIRLERLVQDPKGELSMRIQPGYRAMSIEMTQEAGVSNLVKVGDFVDILIFLPELKEKEQVIRPTIEKMVFQNFEVLAVGQELYRQSAGKDVAADAQPPRYTVTFAVPVDQTEKLALAEDIGQLKMALRPLEPDIIYPSKGAIWQELLLNDAAEMKNFFPSYDVETSSSVPLANNGDLEIEKYIYYTAKPGDTLKSISVQHFGSEERYLLLKQINNITDDTTVLEGMAIKIPVLKK